MVSLNQLSVYSLCITIIKEYICARFLLEVVSLNQLSVYPLCITIIKEYICARFLLEVVLPNYIVVLDFYISQKDKIKNKWVAHWKISR